MMMADAANGLALALSFALLWHRRSVAGITILAAQSALVALAALAAGAWLLAAVLCVWGVAGLPWLLPRLLGRGSPRGSGRFAVMLGGAALAAVCLPVAGIGPGLAVGLLGALLAATRRDPIRQIIGLAALQNGIVLAGLASGAGLALAAVPLVPALALGATWIGRRHRAIPKIPHLAVFVPCAALFLLSCALPAYGGFVLGPVRLSAAGIYAAILISFVVAALRFPGLGRSVPSHPAEIVLALAAVAAVLVDDPGLAWLALTIATACALIAAPAHRLPLACIGLGLALLGCVLLPAAPLPALACRLAGYACISLLSSELAVLSLLLVLRLPVVMPGHDPASLDPLLIAGGLLALGASIAGLLWRHADRRVTVLAMLGQSGVAVFALGLDTPQARFAALVQVTLLVFTRLAAELAVAESVPRMVALAGLAGLPPFGLFPGLALILAATAAESPPLLVPLVPGVMTLGWLMLRRLHAPVGRVRPALSWVPLALLLVLGFAMPAPLADGLRSVAAVLR